MARTPTLAPASRIRIEDEVWEEAFSSRVPARHRSARTAVSPVRVDAVSQVRPSLASPVRAGDRSWEQPPQREARAREEAPRLRLAESPYDTPPPEGRRTVRIQGRGADRYHPSGFDRARPSSSSMSGRMTSSPDRLAMWATLLGFVLVLVAVLSTHF